MRRTAATGLGFAGLFLSIVAVLVGSPGLFYMSTAVIATILASRLQAWLAVQNLQFQRIAPPIVTAGDKVTVEMQVASTSSLRRPLISVRDSLPKRLFAENLSPSLPVAPSNVAPVRTQYSFAAVRRGRFKWSGVTVGGMDALGLALIVKAYPTEPAELIVWPRPEQIGYEIPHYGGFGSFDEGSSQSRGGIEPFGVREYQQGDALRHVHWRSSAKAGRLLVKDFEAGSTAFAAIVVQLDLGSDLGGPPMSTLDRMAGHAAFICDDMERHGCLAFFPQFEDRVAAGTSDARHQDIKTLLADIRTDPEASVGRELSAAIDATGPSAAYYVFATVVTPQLIEAVARAERQRLFVQVFFYEAGTGLLRTGSHSQTAAEPSALNDLEDAGAKLVRVSPLTPVKSSREVSA